MKVLRAALATLFVATIPLLLGVAPAGASLTGKCTASGTIKGKNYDPKVLDNATIPRKGVIAWKGAAGSGNRHISGKVFVKLPPPIGNVRIGHWNGPSGRTANSGNYKYDFPKLLVGLQVPVSGHHEEPGIACSGSILVKLSGSKLSNPILVGSLALTVICVVNAGLAVRSKRVLS